MAESRLDADRGCAGSRCGSTCSRASSSTPGSWSGWSTRTRSPGSPRTRRSSRRRSPAAATTTSRSRELLESTDDPREIFFELAIDDVRDACDVLRPVWDADRRRRRLRRRSRSTRASRSTRRRRSSRRSTCTRGSTGRTSTSRSRPRARACRRSRSAIAARHPDQRDADLLARALRRGRRRLPARRSRGSSTGGDPSKVTSVASFFVSRLDTEADARLEALGNTELAGQARDREREARLQALPGGLRRRRAGSGSQPRARRCSGRSGPRPRPRTRPTATCMYVEELIGPDTVNTMPLETLEAFPTTARCAATRCSRASTEAEQLLADLARGGRRLRRRRGQARDRGRPEVRRRLRRADRGHRGQAGRAGGDVTTERRELVARIWSRDPTVWTGADEARWLGWLDEPFRMRDDVDRCCGSPRTSSSDVDAVVLLGMGGSSLAPEVLRQSFGVETLPRPRHDASRRRSARLEAKLDLEAHALHLGVEVGLDARDPLAHRLLLEARAARRAVGGDHRPGLARSPSSRTSASSPPSSPASRRSAAATRRSRRSGSCPAALMGVDVAGLLDRAMRDGRRLPARRGQPGPRARAGARRGVAGRPRQGVPPRRRRVRRSGSSS